MTVGFPAILPVIPRDCNDEFEPRIIGKYERTSNQLEEQIIAMYAKGMSTRNIENHMRDIYGIDVYPTRKSVKDSERQFITMIGCIAVLKCLMPQHA